VCEVKVTFLFGEAISFSATIATASKSNSKSHESCIVMIKLRLIRFQLQLQHSIAPLMIELDELMTVCSEETLF